MWVADSDFKAPEEVVNAVIARAKHGVYGYPAESRRLKTSVSAWLYQRHGLEVREEEVAYCPGVIPGVICGIRAFSEPGDGIIIQTPCYPPFVQAVERNLRRPERNPLFLKDGRYEIDFEGFEALCRKESAKIFILCNPHNPTGRVFSQNELSRMSEICSRNNVVVLSDEIHGDIIYPGHRHIPLPLVSESAAQNSVTFLAASKTFNVPGLNTAAYYAKNPALLAAMGSKIAENKGYRENIFGTLALCESFEKCGYYADELCEYLTDNLRLAAETFRRIPGMKLISPEGTYLLWIDCRALELTQEALVSSFVSGARVGIQSGTDFGEEGEGFVRMNIACPKSTLSEALSRITAHFQ